ncbi:ABC transporter substrate-binding protein [Corynebacterium sp. H130]|uniref:ABC transporter substrate-binding protein n=1 Tax=Corynebacterium sp. H130 TaxID=3133444 RepID=UPI0030B1388B
MKKIIAGLLAISLLTACGTDATNNAPAESSQSASTEGQFPRTVKIGDSEVKIAAKPQRIAALTADLTSLVLPIAGKDRMVIATELNPELGQVASDAAAVPTVLKVGAPIDPEQILASKPDLVLASARHDAEKDAIAMLKNNGVPMAVISTDDWGTIDDILTHVDEVAELTGDDAAGAELRKKIEEQRKANLKQATGEPKVLTLMHRGGKNLIMPKSTLLNGLVREVGGKPVIDTMGAPGSAPADPEAILKANPDVIIIQNYRGKGAEDFKPVLENPALAEVPAIKNGKVFYADTVTTGVTSAERITEGLKQVSEFLS